MGKIFEVFGQKRGLWHFEVPEVTNSQQSCVACSPSNSHSSMTRT